MAGNTEGGIKARDTNRKTYGADFYQRIGAMGGRLGHTGGFASNVKGTDGLTGKERAIVAGQKGGKLSKRGKAIEQL